LTGKGFHEIELLQRKKVNKRSLNVQKKLFGEGNLTQKRRNPDPTKSSGTENTKDDRGLKMGLHNSGEDQRGNSPARGCDKESKHRWKYREGNRKNPTDGREQKLNRPPPPEGKLRRP